MLVWFFGRMPSFKSINITFLKSRTLDSRIPITCSPLIELPLNVTLNFDDSLSYNFKKESIVISIDSKRD